MDESAGAESGLPEVPGFPLGSEGSQNLQATQVDSPRRVFPGTPIPQGLPADDQFGKEGLKGSAGSGGYGPAGKGGVGGGTGGGKRGDGDVMSRVEGMFEKMMSEMQEVRGSCVNVECSVREIKAGMSALWSS